MKIVSSILGIFENKMNLKTNEEVLLVSREERTLAINSPTKGIISLSKKRERIQVPASGINGFKNKQPLYSPGEKTSIEMTYEITANITTTGASTVKNIVLPESFSSLVAYWFVMISHVENDSDVTNLRARVLPGSLNTIEVSFNGGAGGENFNIYASGYADNY